MTKRSTDRTPVKQISFSSENIEIYELIDGQLNSSRYVCDAVRFYEKYKDKNIDLALALYEMGMGGNQVNIVQQPNIQTTTEANTIEEKAKEVQPDTTPKISDLIDKSKGLSLPKFE